MKRPWAMMVVMAGIWIGGLFAVAGHVLAAEPATPIQEGTILVGQHATPLELYAARELQKYLHALSGTLLPIHTDDAAKIDKPAYILGQADSNRFINQLIAAKRLTMAPGDPGEQGYLLKKLQIDNQEATIIAGADPAGVLYGVYGLLEDHYGIGFYMSGDVLPEKKSPLVMADVDEKKAPRQKVRGFTNHWCYMQGSGLWSFEDWKYYIDQMARMRMNLISFHNYMSRGYTEIFLNTEDFKRRNVNQHSNRAGGFHGFCMPLRNYPWRIADLFDDYAYATAASLHNESLDNAQVAMKGVALMQQIIAYAHRRGIKVNLGTEFHLFGPDVQLKLAEYIARNYPDLDQVVYYKDEGAQNKGEVKPFARPVYDYLKQHTPRMGHVLTGWGDNISLEGLPADVIVGPFSAYLPSFNNGGMFPGREYWGGPWLERDGGGEMHGGEMHYMPHKTLLSKTIRSYQTRQPNLNGLVALTWRLTDAIDPKIWYIAQAPWDLDNALTHSAAVYSAYVRRAYGADCVDRIVPIVNENEAYVKDGSDCLGYGRIPLPAVTAQIGKAEAQLAVIDQCIAESKDRGCAARLRLLRNRILGVKLHHGLYDSVKDWETLPGTYADWTQSYLDRVTDMCTLGQLVSAVQMTMKQHYFKAEIGFRTNQTVRAPSLVVARGTPSGAVVTWRNEEKDANGFNVYRDGKKLNAAPLEPTAFRFEDKFDGICTYRVSVVNAKGEESPLSVKTTVAAGSADKQPPRVVVISPPTVSVVGQPVDIEVRATDGRAYECLSATLYFRTAGEANWQTLPMARRCRAIFTARIPAAQFTERGVEYYASVSDGANAGFYPVTAPELPARVVAESLANTARLGVPEKFNLVQDGRTFSWTPPTGDVFVYRIYRSQDAKFTPGRDSLLTYVAACTTQFQDKEPDFEDRPLQGVWHYRVTAVDKLGNESTPTPSLAVDYGSGVNTGKTTKEMR